MMLLMTIVIGAKAADESAILYWESSQTAANSIQIGDFTLAITGNTGKNWGSGNGDITIGSTSYKTLKNSNGAQNTITCPDGYVATGITFYVTTNADSSGKLTEIDGTSCEDVVTSCKDYANPTVISKDIDNKESFTFTFSTKQVCFVAVVTYKSSSAGPENPVFTLSKSVLKVGETAKILVDGKDIFAANFTAGTLWQSEPDCISLSADGVVTALQNTPANYYFHFFGTSKDATKYNSVTSANLNLTIAPKYSVTYDLADATAGTVPTEEDQIAGATFNVAAVPTDLVAPAGKEFKCWNDGTNDYNPGATYNVGKSDITLTAVYQDKTYQGLTPTATLDFANPGTTFSSVWYTTEGKLVKNFDYDPVNGKVVMSAYAVYQSVNAQRIAWETFDSGNSSTDTWEATGDFQGSSYYFESDARAASVQAAARIHYYRVAGITGVSALFNGKAGIEVYEVNSGVVTPDPVDENFITSAGTASLSNLDATKEYIIAVRGNNGTSNIRFYEIAFTFPAITTETITIPTEGFATYVTSSALDFSSQNGAFKAYVASSVNEAKTSVATVEVTKVPAGTALLLKGAVGSYNVEIAESADAVTNLLKASNGGVKGDNSTVFAYSKSAGKFKKVAQDVVIPAGKAYLKLEAAAANPDALDIDFGEQATGINGIAEANEAEAAPVKVIKNGKLYIGNFNVAGQQVK